MHRRRCPGQRARGRALRHVLKEPAGRIDSSLRRPGCLFSGGSSILPPSFVSIHPQGRQEVARCTHTRRPELSRTQKIPFNSLQQHDEICVSALIASIAIRIQCPGLRCQDDSSKHRLVIAISECISFVRTFKSTYADTRCRYRYRRTHIMNLFTERCAMRHGELLTRRKHEAGVAPCEQ